MVDWGIFLLILERMDVKPRKSKAGRPVTCRIVMFKRLILQRASKVGARFGPTVRTARKRKSRVCKTRGTRARYMSGGIGYRGKVLDEHQKASNTVKFRVRARVEHVFGHMENAMGGIGLRTIGLARAKLGVVLMDLAGSVRPKVR
jgi:hypothetical protein